jgi:type VI secretion system secreted protein Hcp
MKKIVCRAVTMLLAAPLLALCAPASAAWFLKMDTIPGESTDANHRDWIELQTVSWRNTNLNGCPTLGTGQAVLTKAMDKASPLLAQSARAGRLLGTATIEQTGPGAQALTIELQNILISGISASKGSDRPMESISLKFAAYRVSPNKCAPER